MVAPKVGKLCLVLAGAACAQPAPVELVQQASGTWPVGNGNEWDGNAGAIGNWTVNGPRVAWEPNAKDYDPNRADYDPNRADYDPNGGAWVYDPNTAFFIPATGQFVANAADYDPNRADYDPNRADYDPNRGDYDPNAVIWDAATGRWVDPVSGWVWNATAAVFWDPVTKRYFDPATRRMHDPSAPAFDPARAFDDPDHEVGIMTPYNTWGLQIDRTRTTRYARFELGGAARYRSQRLMVVDNGVPRELTGTETFPVIVYLTSLPPPTVGVRLTLEIKRNPDTTSARGDVSYDDYDVRFTREQAGGGSVTSPWMRHVSFWYPLSIPFDASRQQVRPATSGVWFYTARNPDGIPAAPLWKGAQVVGLVLGTSVKSNGVVIASTDTLAFTLASAITNLVVVDDFNPSALGKQPAAVSYTINGQHFAASGFSHDGRNDLADEWGVVYEQLAHDPTVENRLTLGEVKAYFNPPPPTDPRCAEACPFLCTEATSPDGGGYSGTCSPNCAHPACAGEYMCAGSWSTYPCPTADGYEPETIDDYHDEAGAHVRHVEVLDGLNWQRRNAFRDHNDSELRAHLYSWYVNRSGAVSGWWYDSPYEYMDWIYYASSLSPAQPEKAVLIVAVSPQNADACTTNRTKVMSECPPVCGNGFIDMYESCDDGNTVDGDGCPANCYVGGGASGGDAGAPSGAGDAGTGSAESSSGGSTAEGGGSDSSGGSSSDVSGSHDAGV